MQIFTFTAVFSGYLTPEIITANSLPELNSLVTKRLLADTDFLELMGSFTDELNFLEINSAERVVAKGWVDSYLQRDGSGHFTITEEFLNFLQLHLFEPTLEVLSSFGYSVSAAQETKDVGLPKNMVMPAGLTEEQFKQMARRLREKLQKIANVDIGHAKSIQVLAEALYSKPFEEAKETALKQHELATLQTLTAETANTAPMQEYFSKSESEIAAMVTQGLFKAAQNYIEDLASHEVQYTELRADRPYWLTIGIEQAYGKNALNSMLKFCLGESEINDFLLAFENSGCTELALPVIFEGESFGLDPSLFKNAEVFSLTPSCREMKNSGMKTFTRT